jgi:dolichyl-phosphate-mannose-protein mannosyltransferase
MESPGFIRPTRVGVRAALAVVLTIHAAALAWGAYRHAPTIDEVAYLAAGLSHWHFGRSDLANVSPPLVRLVAALPVLIAHPRYDWHTYQSNTGPWVAHVVGIDFMKANGSRTFWLFTLGRFACIGFSLIGAYVCFLWSRELYGEFAGLLALVFWCFSPSVLGNGQLLSPDVGVSALGVAASYVFWRWLKQPDWGRCLKAGVLLGLAELAKTNAIVLFPLWPALWLSWTLKSNTGKRNRRRECAQLSVTLLIGLYVINLGYGFEGSFQKLRSYVFTSKMLGGAGSNRFASTGLGLVPVPVPRNYILGIDAQKSDFENIRGQRQSYLRGRWYGHGWWWYYFYVLAVKGPLGMWGAVFVATGLRFLRGQRDLNWRNDLTLLAPGVAMFALACSQSGFSHHLRYVLPALPFVFIWASQTGNVANCGRSSKVIAYTTRGLVLWLLVSSISIWPHSLAYFNELAGGPQNGHFHLLESNIDWGEDLLYLRDWIAAHPQARPLYVAYWGIVDPILAGIDFPSPQVRPISGGVHRPTGHTSDPWPPGWYAISVKNLRGDDRFGRKKCESFLRRRPVDRVGYSILVYRID